MHSGSACLYHLRSRHPAVCATVMELPQQSDTRWVCKHKAVEVFKLRLDSVLKTLEYFAQLVGRNGKERAEAKGLLLQLHSLKVCFVLDLLLPVVNCTSKYMQNKDADIATATHLVSSTVVALEAMRTDMLLYTTMRPPFLCL